MSKLAYSTLLVLIITIPIPIIAFAEEPGMKNPMQQPEESQAVGDETLEEAEALGVKQKLRDASITASIKTKMMLDGKIDAMSINIDTVNQVVTLNGEVESTEQVFLAEQVASQTTGVVAVFNNLQVQVSDGT